MRTRLIWVIAGFAAAAALVGAAVLERSQRHPAAAAPSRSSTQSDPELDRIRAAVETALTAEPPRGYSPIPKGVRLLSIARADDAVVLDFSRELLSEGTGRVLEDSIHQILTAASGARPSGDQRAEDYTLLVNGVPLEQLL